MPSVWGIILYSGFFPFFASVLLVITPQALRKYSYRVLKALFFFDFGGAFYPIINFFLVFEGVVLGYLMKDAYDMTNSKEEQTLENVAAFTLHPKSRQWRSQRNCYATAWAFTSWWMLYTLLAYEERIYDKKAPPSSNQDSKKKK